VAAAAARRKWWQRRAGKEGGGTYAFETAAKVFLHRLRGVALTQDREQCFVVEKIEARELFAFRLQILKQRTLTQLQSDFHVFQQLLTARCRTRFDHIRCVFGFLHQITPVHVDLIESVTVFGGLFAKVV